MNKPASKEPSMDEILSSIRQIIADDDAAAPRRPPVPPVSVVAPAAEPPATEASAADPAPLALTPEQILRDDAASHGTDDEDEGETISFADLIDEDDANAPLPELDREPPPLLDPDDVAFEGEDEDEPMEGVAAVEPVAPTPAPPPPRMAPPPPPPPRAAPSAARAAPMPDPTLSEDMAEQLLEPATGAAVKDTFAKLSGMSAVGSAVTLEALMRDMLRPMLKEWLDENLPSVVERMVEKEIARVSRGRE